MSPELQAYYERRLSMCGDPAWKELCEDVEAMIQSTNNLEGVDSIEKLHFRKGELSIMKWILNLKQISEESYKQLQEDSQNEREIG